MKLLQIDFPIDGPFGEEMSIAFKELAQDISNEKGLIWKIWTENKEENIAGGVYLFEDLENANRYLQMHAKRLNFFGIENIRSKVFDINLPLSLIDKADFLK